MNLKQLKARGGLVMDQPVKREIEWTHVLDDGEEVTDKFDVWVRRLPYGDVEKMILDIRKGGTGTQDMISAAIRLGKNGDEKLSVEDVYQLNPKLAELFSKVVGEVNAPPKKTSPPKTNSGTNSSSPASAEEPSPKPSSASVTPKPGNGPNTSSATEAST